MMKVHFLRHLDTRELPHNTWELLHDFHVQVEDKDKNEAYAIIVPRGFLTDFASVPRIPFAYMLYGGIGNKAAVIHDALYSCWSGILCVNLRTGHTHPRDRAWADKVFYCMLKALGIHPFKSYMMYKAVRLFGWKFYKANVCSHE
jgi:hypothetical protein